LFDWGQARTAKAEAIYRQSAQSVAETAVRAASEVRELHATRASSHAIATRFRDELLPQRKKISDEVLLRYNGMLTGVFELLADAREQVATVNAAIEAQRDFWLADADFQMALHSGSPQ
jgi:outer membrane protein TolC